MNRIASAETRSCGFNRVPLLSLLIVMFIVMSGCKRSETAIPDKLPRPVIVKTLTKTRPPTAKLVSASVASWKTEQIGFEVGGRVESVAEPNTEIEGRVVSRDGKTIVQGTPVGRLENERYDIQVSRAKAEVTRAEKALEAAETQLNESIPAQIAAAEASVTLAKTEYERSKRLKSQNAGSQEQVDRDRSNFETAIAQLKQLEASEKAQKAEVESLGVALLQSQQTLRDAERNLEDCTLYSSFRGQVAAISVVPGSVVSAGQPVATVQMMNPIKVEVEVSAKESRQLQQREMLPLMINMPDGSQANREGFLYLIDPIADSSTRTFTLTLLVMNEQLSTADNQGVATTDDVWRLDLKFLPGAEEGMLFVGEDALLQDQDGYYLWQITNATIQSRSPGDHKFNVRKLRVKLGQRRLPFLGNWIFQQVEVDDPEFDPAVNMVIGKLKVDEGRPETWNGDSVVLDPGGQWLLRPGDLVKVDLSDRWTGDGYYVPMNAIVRSDDQSYLFTIANKDADGVAVVKRMPIELSETEEIRSTSSLRLIRPLEGETFDDMTYVTEGAHYLIDGESVRVVADSGAGQ